MRRGLVAAAVALLTAVGAAACTPVPVVVEPVQVTGALGVAPTLSFATPLTVTSRRVEVIAEGTGPQVRDGGVVLLDYYAESAEDGSLIGETYSDAPRAYRFTVEGIGRDIYETLEGRRVGARVLQVLPATDTDPATVAVLDLLPTRAGGSAVDPREGLPTVTLDDDGAPTVTVVDAQAPAEVVAQPLIRGEGPQVQAGQIVTVQYTGVTWDDGTVFDSTWGADGLPAAFPIGVGSVPEGWDEGLVEQTVGSQVLLVLPPGSGYAGTDNELADQTLVFVVDILAATGGPEGS